MSVKSLLESLWFGSSERERERNVVLWKRCFNELHLQEEKGEEEGEEEEEEEEEEEGTKSVYFNEILPLSLVINLLLGLRTNVKTLGLLLTASSGYLVSNILISLETRSTSLDPSEKPS